MRRLVATGLAAAVLAGGCRTPDPSPVAVDPPPASLPPPDFAVVPAGSLEPDLTALPRLDPAAVPITPSAVGRRGLTEAACAREAAARAPLAASLEHENRVPADGCPPADGLLKQVRAHLAAEARNRAAGGALDEFYQLADADGRADVVREAVGVLDRLRATVKEGRAKGLRVPVEPDELDRQRAGLVALLSQADLGAALLDGELKRRLGVPFSTPERLRPVGPFPPVTAGPTDVTAAVKLALEKRPDLHALRSVYLGLTPETLEVAREAVRNPSGLLTVNLPRSPAGRKPKPVPPELLAELGVRQQQLADLIADRERQAADQVRAACLTLDAQARQVGLARWRAETLARKAADAAKDGPLVELPARLEADRARADVVAAVMGYHQARVKLRAAQGVAAE